MVAARAQALSHDDDLDHLDIELQSITALLVHDVR